MAAICYREVYERDNCRSYKYSEDFQDSFECIYVYIMDRPNLRLGIRVLGSATEQEGLRGNIIR